VKFWDTIAKMCGVKVNATQWGNAPAFGASHGGMLPQWENFDLLKIDARGYAVDVRPMEQGIASWMHPGRSAEVTCKGKVIGNLFEIHPSICTACDLPGRAAAATLDWNALMVMEPSVAIVKALPAFPAVTYDETVPAKAGTRTSSLLDGLRAVDPLLESVEIVNLYQNPADITDKRLTLHFVYRSPERTLLQAESDAAHAKVLAHVKGKIG
jgi:phenylalanyl-tRNA synthetase beta chain